MLAKGCSHIKEPNCDDLRRLFFNNHSSSVSPRINWVNKNIVRKLNCLWIFKNKPILELWSHLLSMKILKNESIKQQIRYHKLDSAMASHSNIALSKLGYLIHCLIPNIFLVILLSKKKLRWFQKGFIFDNRPKNERPGAFTHYFM